jgi:hypothetical protein
MYKYIFLFIYLIVIILLILLIIHYNKINYEYFSNNNECEPGNICTDENSFGILNSECECIELEEQIPEHQVPEELEETEQPIQEEESEETSYIVNPNCIPNQDFNQYCKNMNPNMGVDKVIPCNQYSSEVYCDYNKINGVEYGLDTVITPCVDKMSDFDELCKYYNNKTIPPGYNVDSIGAKKILVGAQGDCYAQNGTSNEYKARAICNNNYVYTIPKLDKDDNVIDYNTFTDCLPINNTNFTRICSFLLKNPFSDTSADEIMGYDCNPGYGRAKCLKKIDKINSEYDSDNFNKYIYKNVLT